MNIRLLDVAQEELEQAVAYYNIECPGLGFEFADEIYRGIERIEANPKAWQSLSQRTRRCVARRFPYGIVYQFRDSEILITAIMHLHREPDAWRGRTP